VSLLQQGKKGSASLTGEHALKLGTGSQQVSKVQSSTVSLAQGTRCHTVGCIKHRHEAPYNYKLPLAKPRRDMMYVVVMLDLAFDVYAFTVQRAVCTTQMGSSVDKVRIKYLIVNGSEAMI
jgi:hypothetical protein